MTQVREDAVRQIVLANNAPRTSLSAYDAIQSLESAAQNDVRLAPKRNKLSNRQELEEHTQV